MDFYEVTCQDGRLAFSNGETALATEEEKGYFKIRNKLLSIKKEDGSWQIVRWNDIHRHSGLSLLDSSILIDTMAAKTEYAGAITDHGTMRGALDYFKAMKNAGKFPIIGEEFYMEDSDGKLSGNHLILLAKNYEGYQNLVKLSSEAYNHIHSKPHITRKLLNKYHDNLICTSACLSGEISRKLANDEFEQAETVVEWYKELFGADYYLEIQRHGISIEDVVNPKIIIMAKKHKIKLVAATDAHYVDKEDGLVHLSLLCIGTKTTVNEPARKFDGSGYHLQTADEMEERFHDLPEALDNTLDILQKCKDFTIKTGDVQTPKFAIPAPYASDEAYFEHLCKVGMVKRYGQRAPDGYEDRLTFEIQTVEKMKFCGYFLIVQDFINWAKDNGIPVGPGRGSAAGSLAAYVLGITEIDPMKYNLLFERFLNPDRISMPDVDTDFSPEGRPRVIEYVRQKYGANCVSKIIDISCMRTRVTIKDVARVFDLSPLGNIMSKAVPDDPKITLQDAMKNSAELQQLYQSNPDAKKIWDIALKLEGVPRQVSVHACGILIAPSEVSDFMPQEIAIDKDTKERAWVTQYVGSQCEEMGLLKMDFLGLRTLDVMYSTIDKVKRQRNIDIKFDEIPINDPHAYKLLQQGRTDGVFQLESPGMTNLMKKIFYDVHVDDSAEKGNEYFERLIAAVALYRPGPMDCIPQYLDSMKSGRISYDTPQLESVLKNTYGVLVYQEQAMSTVRTLAGFSKGQSDIIRKAMSKKKTKLLAEYGEYFLHGSEPHDKKHPDEPLHIAGCVKNGIPETTAKIIWDKMEKFGAYAFNKSHACAYAVIASKTAWLSRHYPVEFMASTLDSWIGDAKKMHVYVKQCKQKNISLMPPDINKSHPWFEIETIKSEGKKSAKGIRFAMNAISGIGGVMAEGIESEKIERGPFLSIDDFVERMGRYQKFSPAVMETLIYSGTMDCFPGTRAAKIKALPQIAHMLDLIHHTNYEQVSLFDLADMSRFDPIKIPDVQELSMGQLASHEEECLGFIQNYPTTQYRSVLARKNAVLIADLPNDLGTKHVFVGIVKNIVHISFAQSSSGLLRFEMEDESGSIACVAYSSSMVKLYENIAEGEVCYVQGTASDNPKYGLQAIINNSFLMTSYEKRAAIAQAI